MSPQSTIHFAFLSIQGYIFVKQQISTYKRYFREISRSPDIFTTEISTSIYFIKIFLTAKQNIFQIFFFQFKDIFLLSKHLIWSHTCTVEL